VLRLLCFVALVLVLRFVLGFVPVVGDVLSRSGLIGLWVLAIALSWFLSRWTERALLRRRDASKMRALEAVPSAHNQGKVGTMRLAHGRAKVALEALEKACAGEPNVAEWHYRRGQALLALRRAADAARAFERAVEIDEEHAYGAVLLRLAECELALGRGERALEVLARFERNHGPNPESAYRRGRALKKLGRAGEARRAFAEVKGLATSAAAYQRRSAAVWSLRAMLGRLV
jgi:tetratricopeptide (TPR) repeat protein